MKNNLIAGLVIIGAVLLSSFLFKPEVNVTVNPEPPFGAVSGPDIYSTYLSVNGVTSEFTKQTMKAATTTICAIRSPLNATSTLDRGTVVVDVSSTTASLITIAKASTAFATTTLYANAVAIAANAQSLIVASSSDSVANGMVFSPGQWLTVGMSGGVGTFSPTGVCTAEFRVVR